MEEMREMKDGQMETKAKMVFFRSIKKAEGEEYKSSTKIICSADYFMELGD